MHNGMTWFGNGTVAIIVMLGEILQLSNHAVQRKTEEEIVSKSIVFVEFYIPKVVPQGNN